MSTPINLNKVRKARAQEQKKRQASENAVRFGRTKAEKTADLAARERAARTLDGASLGTSAKGDDAE